LPRFAYRQLTVGEDSALFIDPRYFAAVAQRPALFLPKIKMS
jgi:hypothetical protein